MPTIDAIVWKDGSKSTVTHGKNYRDDGTWYRNDTYQYNDERPVIERFFSGGPDDDSPHFSSYGDKSNGEYDPRCSCCYLNFGHTVDEHNKNLEESSVPYEKRYARF